MESYFHQEDITVDHKRFKLGFELPTFSQIHEVGNNGINANFVLPYICSFLHYLGSEYVSKCGIRCQLVKGISFKFTDFIGLLNFEWHSQNKVGNIGFLYCGTL